MVRDKWTKFRRFSNDGPKCSILGLNRFVTNSLGAMRRGERWISDCHMLPQWEFIEGPSGHQWCKHKLPIKELTPEFNRLMENYHLPLRMAPHTKKNSAASQCPGLKRRAETDLD